MEDQSLTLYQTEEQVPTMDVGMDTTLVEPEVKDRNLCAATLQLTGHDGEVYTTKFSECGDFLASAGADKQILLWNVYSDNFGNTLVLKGHKNAVLDLSWSQDSTRLYTCSADKSICVWDLVEGKKLRKYTEHTGIVNSVQCTKLGENMFVSSSDDFTVKLWDDRAKTSASTLDLDYQVTTALLTLKNDQVWYSGVDNQIKAWNLTTGAPNEQALLGHSDTVTGLALSRCGRYLMSNSMDKSVKIWDLSGDLVGATRCTKTMFGIQHNFEKNLLRCAWNHDGTVVSAGSSDGYVVMWDTHTGEMVDRLDGHQGSINETCFHPKENIIASASSDTSLIVGYY